MVEKGWKPNLTPRSVRLGGLALGASYFFAQGVLKASLMATHPHLNPFEHFLLYNSGDFGDAYIIAALGAQLARNKKSGLVIGGLAGLLAVTAAEVAPVNHLFTPIFGHDLLGNPDLLDMPAGVLGVGASLGIEAWAQKIRRDSPYYYS